MVLLVATLLAAAPGDAGQAPAPAPAEVSVKSVRRERTATFAVDEALQAQGGMQYFFALEPAVLPDFAALDAASGPHPYVMMSRIVHTLDKDASFFSAERVLDLDYMRTVGPQFQLTQKAPGVFRVGRTPANDFTLEHLGEAELTATPRAPALDQVDALCGAGPQVVVVQRNTGFSRVMGWRTAEASFTFTAHHRVTAGRTRVCVVTMSYLVNVPPFFLGGARRVHDESLKEALALIRALRVYPVP
jgi:hypothetical protein